MLFRSTCPALWWDGGKARLSWDCHLSTDMGPLHHGAQKWLLSAGRPQAGVLQGFRLTALLSSCYVLLTQVIKNPSSSCHRRSSFCRKVPEKPLLESTWSYSYTLLSAPATRASRTAGSSRGLLVTLGGRCLSQFRPQGLPQDNLSLVIHLMGWVLPLGPEISPSLHHSWVRPVTTPPPCDFLRGLAVGPCPPASPPVPGWGPILGLTY